MKKLLLLVFVIFMINTTMSFGQTNILPTSGKVGIGTTLPKVELQVNGNSRISGNLNVGDSLSSWIPFSVNQKTPYIYSARFAHSGSSENRQLSIGYLNGAMGIWASTFDGGNATNLLLNSNGGNIGIGTNDPITKLTVAGAFTPSYMQMAVKNSTLDEGIGISFNEIDNVRRGHIYAKNGNGLILGDETNYGFRVFSGGSEVLTARSNGNVGISNTNPDAKFRVTSPNADFRIDYNGTGQNFYDASNYHLFRDNAGNGKLLIYANQNATHSYNNFTIYTKTGTGLAIANSNTASEWNYTSLIASNSSRSHYYGSDPNKDFVIGSDDATKNFRLIAFKNTLIDGNVGIGTSAPTAKLDIAPPGDGKQSISIASSQNKAVFYTYDTDKTTSFAINGNSGSNTRLFAIHSAGATQGSAFNGSIFEVYGHNGISNIASISANNNGNVGIGTTTPTNKLEVASGNTTSGLTLTGFKQTVDGPKRNLGVNMAGEVIVMDPSSSGAITFTVGGDGDKYYPVIFSESDEVWNKEISEFTISHANVHTDGEWWGSAVAKFRFHSNRWGHGSSFLEPVVYQANPGAALSKYLIAGWKDTPLSSDLIVWMRGKTTYAFKGNTLPPKVYDGTQNPLPYKEIGGANSFIDHNVKTAIDPYVEDNPNPTWKKNGNNLYSGNTGNVGIGTVTPQAKLDIKGNSLTGIQYLRTDAQDARISIGDNSGKVWSWATGWGGGTAGDFSLIEEGIAGDRIYIKKSSGNVGIGTTTPTQKLEINTGHLGFSNNYGLQFKNAAGGFGWFSMYPDANNKLQINANNANMTLDAISGNIGVGTTTPTNLLTINSKIDKKSGLSFSNLIDKSVTYVADKVFPLGVNLSGEVVLNEEASLSNVWKLTGANISNTNGGNVGIGTESPKAKLDINGDILTSVTSNAELHSVEERATRYIGHKSGFTADGFTGMKLNVSQSPKCGNRSSISFQTWGCNVSTSRDIMVLNDEGNVGIGTSTIPTGYKLAIAGDMIAERVVVKLQANWPDYVFKTGYSLRPLSEVESFVKANNHLPDVPSEAEVKAKGIDMEQMNATLLKKVEELTLYMIELQKQNDALKKRMDNLDKK